jgi:hypothetical protein
MNMINAQKYPVAQAPKKVGPFLPRINDGSILGRHGEREEGYGCGMHGYTDNGLRTTDKKALAMI